MYIPGCDAYVQIGIHLKQTETSFCLEINIVTRMICYCGLWVELLVINMYHNVMCFECGENVYCVMSSFIRFNYTL